MEEIKTIEENIEDEERKYILYIHTVPKEISGYDCNKHYVGITKNKTYKRWGKNGANYEKCTYFWRAIQKYGWDNILHKVVFKNLTKTEASDLERRVIKILRSNDSRYGYNLSDGGTVGYTFSDETINKIKESWTPEKRKIWAEKLSKKIICINNRQIFNNVGEASDYAGVCIYAIYHCCSGRLITAGRHPETNESLSWLFYDDYLSIDGENKKNNELIRKRKTVAKQVICLNTMKVYDSATEAAKIYDTTQGLVSMCCRGERKAAKIDLNLGERLVFMYYDDFLINGYNEQEFENNRYNIDSKKHFRKVICLNTMKIYNSVNDVASDFNVGYKTVINWCSNKKKCSQTDEFGNSYIFYYYDKYKENLDKKGENIDNDRK